MNQFTLQTIFSNEYDVIEYFINSRYGQFMTCRFCESLKLSKMKNRPKFFQCNNCNKTFSIFKNTIFEKTRVSLKKWVLAINFVCNNKKSLSALQLQREIGGAYQTSWRMLHQIRKAMAANKNKELFKAIVEVDETYVGGKPKKGKNKSKPLRGRGTNKTPVVGVVERDTGKVYAKVALPNKEGKKLSGKQLLNIINEAVNKDAMIVTDEFTGYKILDKEPERIHLTIDHSKEYARGNIHTNTIEGFWALFKRGIIGSYHHISVKYMQNYVNEFSFRYSNRKNKNIFDLIVKRSVLNN